MTHLTIATVGGVNGTTDETIRPGRFAIGVNLDGMAHGGADAMAKTDYVVPSLTELQYYKSQGTDLIRLPLQWTTLQTTLDGPLTAAYVNDIESVLTNAASLGMKVILDLHDFGGYAGHQLGTPEVSVAEFANLWRKMAKTFVGNPGLGGYDLMNEPHNMPTAAAWTDAAQAAITEVRTEDTKTPIYVEGNDYSNSSHWSEVNPGFSQLHDPSNNLIFSAHVYLDHDNTGGNYDWAKQVAFGVTTNIGVQRLGNFVSWLKANHLKGDIGEIGAGKDNPGWLTALDTTLAYAKKSNLQVTYWAGGRGTGGNPMSVEPQYGVNAPQMAVLDKYSGAYPNVSVATVSGTGNAGATIYLSENEVVLGTTKANASGAWAYKFKGLANGVHVIVASDNPPTADGTIAATVFNLQAKPTASASITSHEAAPSISIAAPVQAPKSVSLSSSGSRAPGIAVDSATTTENTAQLSDGPANYTVMSPVEAVIASGVKLLASTGPTLSALHFTSPPSTITASGANQPLSTAPDAPLAGSKAFFGDLFSGTSSAMLGYYIRNFGGSDKFHITDIQGSKVTQLDWPSSSTGDVLSLTDGAKPVSLSLIGSFTKNSFAFSDNDATGTIITHIS